MIESVSACGWSCTAASTASRGRVTRRPAPRSMRSKSEAVGTLRSLLHLLEPIEGPGEAAALGTTRVAAFNRPSECVDHGPRGRPHDLRHTVASLWIAAGVDIKTASAWRGHPTFGTAGAEEVCRRTHPLFRSAVEGEWARGATGTGRPSPVHPVSVRSSCAAPSVRRMRALRVVATAVSVAGLCLSASAVAQATPDTTGPGVLPQKTQFDLQAHRGGIGMTTEESLQGFAQGPAARGEHPGAGHPHHQGPEGRRQPRPSDQRAEVPGHRPGVRRATRCTRTSASTSRT